MSQHCSKFFILFFSFGNITSLANIKCISTVLIKNIFYLYEKIKFKYCEQIVFFRMIKYQLKGSLQEPVISCFCETEKNAFKVFTLKMSTKH